MTSGERAISRVIMKNRGLVAHKSKINSNPRVKKREQYRKALIRRKGAVREVRNDEGHKYGGEGTGIKSGISRSRKLVS
jgi:U3 small nucleolar RNA-associated protein 3